MNLHLELSNRCVLECPACPRTWYKQTLKRPVPKTDLDISMLDNFLDCDKGQQVQSFQLESNHGDPIYAPQLFELITKWRKSKRFDIVTNGSHQRLTFWQDLKDLLTIDDSITFSVDGLEDTNHLYRINSDWASIMQAMQTMKTSPAKIFWKMIVFKHNQHQILDVKNLAHSLGFGFKLVYSNRFGKSDLAPESQFINFDRTYEVKKDCDRIQAACTDGNMLYVDASGYCWPCCWITGYPNLYKTELWKQREKWHIRDQNLDKIFAQNGRWAYQIEKDPISSHSVCKMMCGQVDQKKSYTI